MWNLPNPKGVLKDVLTHVYFRQHHGSGTADSAFLSFHYILLTLAVTMALNVVICDVVILKGIYRKKQWTEKHGV